MAKKSSRPQILVNGDVVGSIYLRCSVWWFDHRANGVRHFINLRTGDVKQAIARAEVEAQKAPVIPQAQTTVERKAARTLRDALDLYDEQWLTKKCRTSSRNRSFIDTCDPFVTWAGEKRPLGVVSRQLVQAYMDERAKTCSPTTVNGDHARIRAFLKWCVREGHLLGAPDLTKMRLPVDEKSARGLAPREIDVIRAKIKQCKHARIRDLMADWLELGINVGLRPQEQSHLRACDYDAEKRVLHVRPYGDWKLKTRKSRRSLPVNEAAHEILVRRVAAAGRGSEALLFPTSTGTVWDVNNLRNRFELELRADAKVRGSGPFFTLYALRHSFAYRCVTAGWGVERLSLYMGHTDLKTTQGYYEGVELEALGAPPALEPLRKAAQ